MGTTFVRLLGPVQLVVGQEVRDLPSAAQRRLLAMLALAGGTTQRSQYLSEVLELSPSALRTTVHRLRTRLGDDVVRTDSVGYRVTCPVDVAVFTSLLVTGPDGTDRLTALDEALGLWRGLALEEFRSEAWAVAEVARLDELRALAVEDRAELLIARGRPGDALPSLEALATSNPLRDRSQGLLIQALAGSGRQAEALRAFQAYRSHLVEATGTEPSARVRSIERRVATGGDGTGGGTGAETGSEVRTPIEIPLAGQLRAAPELIGRRREVSWLESELVAARAGSSRMVLLGGEAGVGKTTLAAAFARAQHARAGNVVAFGRCAEGATVPLEPFRTIVGTIVEHAPVALLEGHGERCGGELGRVTPGLAERVPVPPPVEADEAIERFRLFEAVLDLLRRVAAGGSLTLVLDDLHWADPTALLLLRHLSRGLADAPVLLIASYRDTEPDLPDDLRRTLVDLERGQCRRLALSGFDDAEMSDLLRAVTGAAEAAQDGVLAHLQGQSAGNPLYAEQLAHHLWESRILSVSDDEIGFARAPSPETLPGSLRDVVWSRVEALGEPAAQVLRCAAVLGASVDDRVLASMAALGQDLVDGAVDRALRAGLLVDADPTSHTIRFTHGLVEHGLYAELTAPERRRLHRRAARALEQLHDPPGPDDVVAIAHHTALAGELDAAQRWAVAAAEHPTAQLASAERAEWFARALALAEERSAPAPERADVMVRLGQARLRAGDARAHETLLAAADLARAAGASDVLVRAALANDRGFSRYGVADQEQLAVLDAAIDAVDPSAEDDLARLLACRAQELVHTTEHDLRLSSAHRALGLVEASADPLLLPRIVSALTFGLWGPHTLELRAGLAGRAVALTAGCADALLEFSTNRTGYYVAIEAADADAASARFGRMTQIADEIGEPRLRWICEINATFEATMQARFADADVHNQRMFDLGTEIGDPDAFGLFAGQMFANRSFAGRYDEVLPLLEQAIADTPESVPFRLAHAISCAVVGRTEEAQEVLDEAAAAGFGTLPETWMWMTTIIGYAVLAIELDDAGAAEALYPLIEPFGAQVAFNGATSQGHVGAYLGKLASLLGDHDRADTHLTRALALNRALGWRYHEATTLVALARSQVRRDGVLGPTGRAWVDLADAISAECGIGLVAADVARLRARDGAPG